jgi:hypothetical protein
MSLRSGDGFWCGFGGARLPFCRICCAFSKCCVHSRENLKLYTRWFAVAGGVSESLEPVLEWFGRVRAKAVSLRASSRVFVGVVDLADEVDSGEVERDGIILPMNVHLFLLGVVAVSAAGLGGSFSLVSSLDRSAIIDCRLFTLDDLLGIPEALALWDTRPSKPKKRPGAGNWLSLRIMRRRRPGAG